MLARGKIDKEVGKLFCISNELERTKHKRVRRGDRTVRLRNKEEES